MCTIEEISEIKPHPNADRLELAQILGYQAVIPKDTFKVGDKIVYVQPDNVLPAEAEWAQEYRKYAPKRIKAIKLRKEWSEGLVINLEVYYQVSGKNKDEVPDVGTDISDIMQIVHYEPPVPPDLAAQGIVIQLPYSMPKTDEKRWEQIVNKIPWGEEVDVSLKVDGQSWSAYYHLPDDKFGILGRRMEFPTDLDNDYTRHIARYNLENKLKKYCQEQGVSLCLRGESYGEGIQSSSQNPHSKLPKGLMIFSVYIIEEHRYALKEDPYYFVTVCQELGLPHVPILEKGVKLTKELVKKYSTGIDKLPNGDRFEGVVIKGKEFSFKVINKTYDSKK